LKPDAEFSVVAHRARRSRATSCAKCQTPVPILPDDVPSHPLAVAMVAPKAEVSVYPWKGPKERNPLAVRQERSFLQARRPAST
jgi:hypothetical protein